MAEPTPALESTWGFPVPARTPAVDAEPVDAGRFLTRLPPGPRESDDCAASRLAAALRDAAASAAVEPKDLLIVSSLGLGALSEPLASVRCYAAVGLGDRLVPFACGARKANPSVTVVAAARPARGMALGWLLDSARTNDDITVLSFNGGGCGLRESAPPEGEVLRAVLAAGATFAARVFPGGKASVSETLSRALRHKGFAFVDCVGLCPVHDESEACERLEKAAYDLAGCGHDAADPEAARRKAEEPFDAPPLGVLHERLRQPPAERRHRLIRRHGPPVSLPGGLTALEQRSLWEKLR
ncbi:MAG: hypothetical protein ABII00_06980 [Elusimicrobiota bacterium]